MSKKMTLSQISEQIGLSDKTLRKYIKNGELKASFEDLGPGQQLWLVDEEDLHECEAATIRNALDPRKVREYDTKDDRIRNLLSELEEKNSEILALENQAKEREGVDEYAILKEELRQQKTATASYKRTSIELLKLFQIALDMHKAKNIEKLIEATGLEIDFEMLDEDGEKWEITYAKEGKFEARINYIAGPDTYDGLYKFVSTKS